MLSKDAFCLNKAARTKIMFKGTTNMAASNPLHRKQSPTYPMHGHKTTNSIEMLLKYKQFLPWSCPNYRIPFSVQLTGNYITLAQLETLFY